MTNNNADARLSHIELAAQAERTFSNSNVSLPQSINALLQPLIGTFKAISAEVLGNNGERTPLFSSVIFDSRDIAENKVPIDSVAAIIETCDELTIESLQELYNRLRQAKSLVKSDVAQPEGGDTSMTTGMIVAKHSSLTLEEISAEMGRLNEAIPCRLWPDLIGVLNKGVINYTANIPGSNSNSDFFLPSHPVMKGALVFSVNVQRTIRASVDHTFNKIAVLIMKRVAIFQPGIRVPGYLDEIKQFPQHGANTESYQFNLANELKPVTREAVIASHLPADSYNVMSGNEVLASIQFQPWQDGGVIIVRGRFPIDIFLVFLAQVVPNLAPDNFGCFRNPGIQVSYVLAISKAQFLKALDLFQRRSGNMQVQKDVSKILVRKLANEGTSTPFFARLMAGMFDTQAIVSSKKEDRDSFFDLYNPVMTNLRSAREAVKDIRTAWTGHKDKIASGDIVKYQGRKIEIRESIDRELKRDLDSFLTATGRAMKNALQKLTKDFGIDIGGFFDKESKFLAGISVLRASDLLLADYLVAARVWSEPLQTARNLLEHGTFPEPEVGYDTNVMPVNVIEPLINGRPITVYVDETLDRVCCFVEEVTTYCLQKKMPNGLSITEIPVADRTDEFPVRFRLTVVPGGPNPWVLTSHTRSFENA